MMYAFTHLVNPYFLTGARIDTRLAGTITGWACKTLTRVLDRYNCSYEVYKVSGTIGVVIDVWTVDLEELRRSGVSEGEIRSRLAWHCRGSIHINELSVGDTAEIYGDIPFMLPSALMVAYGVPITVPSPLDRWKFLLKSVIDIPRHVSHLIRQIHVHLLLGMSSVHFNISGMITRRDAEYVAFGLGEMIGRLKMLSTSAISNMREYVRSKIATQSHTGVVHYASRYSPMVATIPALV
ncbi:MAG: hypothetical protein JRD89_20785 [Deltaproteobacteria bacterium]|nr:hypothetical protein [Deltaproteobacteria bacterium]